jgi:hypothetical protein
VFIQSWQGHVHSVEINVVPLPGLWYKTDEDYNNNVPERGIPLDIVGKMANPYSKRKHFFLLVVHVQQMMMMMMMMVMRMMMMMMQWPALH